MTGGLGRRWHIVAAAPEVPAAATPVLDPGRKAKNGVIFLALDL
jgi:hypothetical protein